MKIEVHALGFHAFAQQTLLNARCRATAVLAWKRTLSTNWKKERLKSLSFLMSIKGRSGWSRGGRCHARCFSYPEYPPVFNETVEKLSFFRQSVFWLRKTRTSESSHTETFSLLKYENRGTRPRFSCVCAANAFECALPRDCCFGVKTDFIDRLCI